MKQSSSTIIAALALAGAAVVGQARAQALGQEIYMQYCATCHGADGKGGGPLTELMTDQPSDLTQLAAENDGVFPMLQVIHVVDGRTGLRAHGGPMPVYGAIFSDEAADPSRSHAEVLDARGRVLSVAYYLESIQE